MREERKDGDTGVSTHNRDGDCWRKGKVVQYFGNESRGADNIEGGNTKESLRIENAGLLENLGKDRDGRVDGI